MLSLRTVTPDTLELLKALMSAPELLSLRLVGGTALALQYGHRVSVDLATPITLPAHSVSRYLLTYNVSRPNKKQYN